MASEIEIWLLENFASIPLSWKMFFGGFIVYNYIKHMYIHDGANKRNYTSIQ